jgi:hypothetical protein
MAIIRSASLRLRLATKLGSPLQAITRKLSSHPKGAIAAFGVFFAVAIVVFFLADLRARYVAAIDASKHSARNYADVLGQRFRGSNHIRPPPRACRTMCG